MPPTFADLGVPADLVAALERRAISSPFPVQALTLPDALAGRDLCGRAPTGSGKTLAFGIALVARLGAGRPTPHRPRSLILVPTRELASQVADALKPMAQTRGRSVLAIYGGVGYNGQVNALRKGLDIAVACPGRLADLINLGHCKLDQVEIVVIDEADRMADMGFLPEVKRILDQTRSDRQTLLYSATLDGDVDALVRGYQRDPARHELASEGEDQPNATHIFWKVTGDERLPTTASIVATCGPTIVFCRTRHGADRVAKQLGKLGVEATAIHGDRSQAQRERALAAFMAGKVGALVATDVAARGIHVDAVAAVVHFDPPADAKDYVHRSGRTARAGADGVVVSFVTPEKAGAVKKLQKDLGVPLGAGPPDLAELTAAPAAGSAPRPKPVAAPVAASVGVRASKPALAALPSSSKAVPSPKANGNRPGPGPGTAPGAVHARPAGSITPQTTASRRQRARQRENERLRSASGKEWAELTPGQRRRRHSA